MVVWNISGGAGSVAVSARPALPKTRATSGTVLMRRSVCCSAEARFVLTAPVSGVIAELGVGEGVSQSGEQHSPRPENPMYWSRVYCEGAR